ncbi:MAG: alpha/beta hydrolase [Pseudomonadota bacterium]|uniref:alpha/beta hydrolase n=1 Tax=Phenylobacterium sp. TaxID=1871053 RepID=UPI002717E3ED|nr:alpha/beta hydrolase [Phenylobacterium sp.]MDO9431597.1 alpha/beta fold hydrolase [Phenylobacterium sp.]
MAQLRVHFATNRNHLPDNKLEIFGKTFNPDGVAALRYGYADFDAGARPTRVEVYPEEADENGFTVKGSDRFLRDLHQCMAGDRSDTLVFIHGFNVSFIGALAAGAELSRQVQISGRQVNIVVFSWPSDGAAVPLMSYYSDREDARASGPALARAFLRLKEFVTVDLAPNDYCQRQLHLLAHSMGVYVLRNGLQAVIAKEPKSLVRLFDQILLAAPDEDDDTFEREDKLAPLPYIGRQVTVYFNPRDRALLISDKTKANPDRLGSDGPRLVDLLPKKVVLVDCRNIASGADELSQHSYYINSRAVSQDIAAVMLGLEPDMIQNREFLLSKRAWRLVTELI